VNAAHDETRLAAFDPDYQPIAVDFGFDQPEGRSRRRCTSVASWGSSFAGNFALTA
jgi:hypothetical protein